MSAPEPNSREAERAAQKVRNVFYFIAAANIAVVAIVMWPRKKPTTPTAATPPAAVESEPYKAPETPGMKEMETVSDRLIAAYTARDAERFAAEFSSKAVPKVDETYFRTVIIGLYHEEFGEVLTKKLTGETNADPDRGMLVYEITGKKGVRAKISTNFLRDSGQLKAMQWRMEKM
jgi:hypothetical protein